MKKYVICALAIMLLLTLTACGNNTADAPAATPEPAPEEANTSLVGSWVYVRSAEGDPGTPLSIYEFEISPPHLEINADNTTSALFWSTSMDGILVQTGTNAYRIADIASISEGEKWNPEDVLLQYDPTTELLRYTVWNEHSELNIHHYFTRAATLDATDETTLDAPEPAPTPTPTPASISAPPAAYTIAQIQTALEPQFQIGYWGEVPPQVVSAQRVAREGDTMWFEPGGAYIDISNSVRYRVEIRFWEFPEEYTERASWWADTDEPSPFHRDGDYTILTQYYHFNDENGNPVLVVVMC
ncbi:MAG: hypothetical protein FWD99_02600 [Oscillospiraceae bacterium]|nr:hypothetical protein [Oscillospiraceae bacterium]